MNRQTHAVRGMWGHRLVVAWLATLILTGPTMAGQSLAGKHATFNVTDRGIGQKAELRLNAGEPRHWTMSTVDPQAQIPIIMPNESKFKSLSTEALRQTIFQDLKAQVSQRMEAGITEFEIQLIQDITLPGYFNHLGPDNRQALVDRFGEAAYGAITDLNRYLRESGVQTTNRAFVGSNGAKVFVANIAAWLLDGQSIWHSVDFFDGRSYLTPTVEAIRKIGASRVRIFNTAGDLWAPFTDWGLRSLANRNTTHYLKDTYFPDLRVYELSVLKKDALINHISGMTDSNVFRVYEYTNPTGGLQRIADRLSGIDLRKPLLESLPRSLPQDTKEGIVVSRIAVEDAVAALSTFAGDFETIYGSHNKAVRSQSVKTISSGMGLAGALLQDLERSGQGEFVPISSHTFEELVKFAIETASDTKWADRPKWKGHFTRLDAYEEFFSGAMEMGRTGKIDVDTMKSYDQGVVELVKLQLTEKNPGLVKNRRLIEQLERTFLRAKTELDDAEMAAYGGDRDPLIRRRQEAKLVRLRNEFRTVEDNLETARRGLKQAEQQLARRLLFLDVVPEMASALAEHARTGKLTIDVVDRYSDMFIVASASVLAYACTESVILAPYAATIRDLTVASARSVRNHLSQETVRKIEEKFSVLEEYLTYQARAVHDRQVIKTWSEIYGYDSLRRLGFTHQQITQQDTQAMQLNIARGKQATSSQAAPHADITGPEPSDIPSVHWQCEGGDQSCPPPDTKNTLRPCGVAGTPPCRPSGSPAGNNDPPDRGPGGAGGGSNRPPCDAPGGPGCGPAAGIQRSPLSPGQPGNTAPRASSTASEKDKPLGGIDLTIQSLVVDSNSGTIAVLTENGSEADAPIAARDLAFAIWLVYSGQQAAFSLDPADPKNPSGKWLKAVYYPESLRATAAGADLFLGDWLLKQYAFGVQVVGDQIVQRHTTTALKSIPQLMEATEQSRTRDNAAQWARMWIVVPRVDVRVSNGIARVVRVDMAVRARRQVPDPSQPTGLRDVDTDDDSIESQFAKQFSMLYTELAQTESPPLLRVRELAKAIAYAQWMKQQKIQVDMNKIVELLNQQRVNAVDRVSALSVDWKKQDQQRIPIPGGVQVRTTTRTVHIFGGVDLAVKPTFAEERTAGTLRDAVLGKLTLARSNRHVVVEHEGHRYQAFVMPFRAVNR